MCSFARISICFNWSVCSIRFTHFNFFRVKFFFLHSLCLERQWSASELELPLCGVRGFFVWSFFFSFHTKEYFASIMSYSLNTFQHKRARLQREYKSEREESPTKDRNEGYLSIEQTQICRTVNWNWMSEQPTQKGSKMKCKRKQKKKRWKQILLRAHRLVWPVW